MGSMKHHFRQDVPSEDKALELSHAVAALKRIADLAADYHVARSHDRKAIVDDIGILARRTLAQVEPSKPVSELVTVREFLSYVASRGYQAHPFLGGTTAVVGYELVGPGCNRKVVRLSPDGRLPLFEAVLWCDRVRGAAKRAGRR